MPRRHNDSPCSPTKFSRLRTAIRPTLRASPRPLGQGVMPSLRRAVSFQTISVAEDSAGTCMRSDCCAGRSPMIPRRGGRGAGAHPELELNPRCS